MSAVFTHFHTVNTVSVFYYLTGVEAEVRAAVWQREEMFPRELAIYQLQSLSSEENIILIKPQLHCCPFLWTQLRYGPALVWTDGSGWMKVSHIPTWREVVVTQKTSRWLETVD